MAETRLESGFRAAYDGLANTKAAAVEGFGPNGSKVVSRVWSGGDLRPSWAFLEALLRENPWPVLDVIASISRVRWEAVPDDPAESLHAIRDDVERLAGQLADALERIDALADRAPVRPVRRDVGKGRGVA